LEYPGGDKTHKKETKNEWSLILMRASEIRMWTQIAYLDDSRKCWKKVEKECVLSRSPV
jgi:hypothetical protein